MTHRRILRFTGADTRKFLQGLVTNDVSRVSEGLVYAALLTPQGKFFTDFFLAADGEDILLDLPHDGSDDVVKRLAMYKLRADVQISDSGLNVQRGTGLAPDCAWADPRHPDMGWRQYSAAPESDDGTDWSAIRVAHCIPESGIELTSDTYILEAGFERLDGVDFKKGCYVGQEVTARMKHKTELRKGLGTVAVSATVAPGTKILSNGRVAGTVMTQYGDRAIAYLRFDRVSDDMTAGDATVSAIRQRL